MSTWGRECLDLHELLESKAPSRMKSMKTKTVRVHDKMQRGYTYDVVALGRDFTKGFEPELTPPEMLRLGVFGGKYMTDCRREFPKNWFARAKLSAKRRDPSLNFFGG